MHRGLFAVAWAVCVVAACSISEITSNGSPNDGGSAGVAGSGASGLGDGSFGATGGVAGAVSGGGGVSGGAGASSGGMAGVAGTPAGGGSAGQPGGGGTGGVLVDCSTYDLGASLFAGTGHCYWISSGPDNFDGAKGNCQSKSGTLASILSAGENGFVQQLLANELTGGDNVWLGGTDEKSPNDSTVGTYKWLTGEPWGYQNWQPGGEPDTACGCGGTCSCSHRLTIKVGSGTWYTRFQDDSNYYVCEAP